MQCGLARVIREAITSRQAAHWRISSPENTAKPPNGLSRYGPAIRTKVVACAHMGLIVEAQEALARAMELQPELSIAAFRSYALTNFPLELLAVFIDGLRKAGMREG